MFECFLTPLIGMDWNLSRAALNQHDMKYLWQVGVKSAIQIYVLKNNFTQGNRITMCRSI